MTHPNLNMSKTAIALRWAARITGLLSILFLSFMILGHIFGNEPQHFNNNREVIGVVLFPGILLLGLIIALKNERIGGSIALFSMLSFFAIIPDAADSILIWALFSPAVFFSLYGWGFKNTTHIK